MFALLRTLVSPRMFHSTGHGFNPNPVHLASYSIFFSKNKKTCTYLLNNRCKNIVSHIGYFPPMKNILQLINVRASLII